MRYYKTKENGKEKSVSSVCKFTRKGFRLKINMASEQTSQSAAYHSLNSEQEMMKRSGKSLFTIPVLYT